MGISIDRLASKVCKKSKITFVAGSSKSYVPSSSSPTLSRGCIDLSVRIKRVQGRLAELMVSEAETYRLRDQFNMRAGGLIAGESFVTKVRADAQITGTINLLREHKVHLQFILDQLLFIAETQALMSPSWSPKLRALPSLPDLYASTVEDLDEEEGVVTYQLRRGVTPYTSMCDIDRVA